MPSEHVCDRATRQPRHRLTCARRTARCALSGALILVLAGMTRAPLAAQGREYVVGPQDILQVTVFNQPDLTGRFPVGGDGHITFPLVGDVKAAGLTTRQIEAGLRSALSPGYLRNPQITVSVDAFRSQQFFVLGEVNTPGQFFLEGHETLIQAIARAGSTKAEASDEVLVVRPRSDAAGPVRPDDADASDVQRLSLDRLAQGDLSENVAIRDGDTIFVPRAAQVFVVGEARSPGAYRYSRTVTILQLLSMAGGATERGATGRVHIVRMVDGKRQEIPADLTDTVQPNDTIVVPEKFF